jgi:hypothetical protein
MLEEFDEGFCYSDAFFIVAGLETGKGDDGLHTN